MTKRSGVKLFSLMMGFCFAPFKATLFMDNFVCSQIQCKTVRLYLSNCKTSILSLLGLEVRQEVEILHYGLQMVVFRLST